MQISSCAHLTETYFKPTATEAEFLLGFKKTWTKRYYDRIQNVKWRLSIFEVRVFAFCFFY